MDFEKLRQFMIVCECENITKAAERLYLSQPALSRTIAQIERELGTELFDRSASRIQINEQGRQMYEFAKHTLDDYDNIRTRIRTAKHPGDGMRIVYSDRFFMDNILPRYLHDISRNIKVQKADESEIKGIIASGDGDVGFSNHMIKKEGLQCQLLFLDYVYVCIPRSNPLSEKKDMYLKDLDGQDILYLDEDDDNLNSFKKILKARAPKHTISSIARREVYEEMKGVAGTLFFLNTTEQLMYKKSESKDRVLIRMMDRDLRFPHYITYKKDCAESVHIFVDWIKNKCPIIADPE